MPTNAELEARLKKMEEQMGSKSDSDSTTDNPKKGFGVKAAYAAGGAIAGGALVWGITEMGKEALKSAILPV